jgi:hypothetical protein
MVKAIEAILSGNSWRKVSDFVAGGSDINMWTCEYKFGAFIVIGDAGEVSYVAKNKWRKADVYTAMAKSFGY